MEKNTKKGKEISLTLVPQMAKLDGLHFRLHTFSKDFFFF